MSLGIIEIIDDTEHLYASPQLIQHGKCRLEKGSFSVGLHSTEFDINVWEGDFSRSDLLLVELDLSINTLLRQCRKLLN